MNKVEEISRMYTLYTKRLNRNKLSLEEFHPLVMNIAYLEIAKAQKNNLNYDTEKIYFEYMQSALEAIPEFDKVVNDPRYSMLYLGFAATAEWDGLWNFLSEYFESNLGIKIGAESMKTLRFDSSIHNRYENGMHVSSGESIRKVIIVVSPDMKNAQFSISESLSNKEGNLFSVSENNYIYIGTDPDFKFEFVLDNYGNVEIFNLIRKDLNLRIEYLE